MYCVICYNCIMYALSPDACKLIVSISMPIRSACMPIRRPCMPICSACMPISSACMQLTVRACKSSCMHANYGACMQILVHACKLCMHAWHACKLLCMRACMHAQVVACMLHACNMHVACMQHACSMHAYFRRAVQSIN